MILHSRLVLLIFGLAFFSVALGCNVTRISERVLRPCGQDTLTAFVSESVEFSPSQIGLDVVDVGFLKTRLYVLLPGREIVSLTHAVSCMI